MKKVENILFILGPKSPDMDAIEALLTELQWYGFVFASKDEKRVTDESAMNADSLNTAHVHAQYEDVPIRPVFINCAVETIHSTWGPEVMDSITLRGDVVKQVRALIGA